MLLVPYEEKTLFVFLSTCSYSSFHVILHSPCSKYSKCELATTANLSISFSLFATAVFSLYLKRYFRQSKTTQFFNRVCILIFVSNISILYFWKHTNTHTNGEKWCKTATTFLNSFFLKWVRLFSGTYQNFKRGGWCASLSFCSSRIHEHNITCKREQVFFSSLACRLNKLARVKRFSSIPSVVELYLMTLYL